MQAPLFAQDQATCPIAGLAYELDFLTKAEEQAIMDVIRNLPLHSARYKQYLARRQVVSFGGSYDFTANKLLPGEPLDARLKPLRDKVAQWLDVPPSRLVQVLVAEYGPGTPLGWHRDVPDYESIAGVSLGSEAILKFRPYPPDEVAKRKAVQLEVAPRSIYKIEKEARWDWQHCVAPLKELRWSITFRTPRLQLRTALSQSAIGLVQRSSD